MMRMVSFSAVVALALLAAWSLRAAAAGDPQRGARLFRQCAACHSVEPGRHMTGPSLAEVWGRRAGSSPDFFRYSQALKGSSIVWNEQNLGRWLKNPQELVPDNQMAFRGVADGRARGDLIAYLKAVSEGKAPPASPPGGGMMGAPRTADLKRAEADSRVTAVRHCGDTYHLTTAAGQTHALWEFNLRFKTDSSSRGPARGAPVLVGAGMMGDRAQLVFSSPGEISTFIKEGC